jgi:hypothetical protein
MELSKQKSEKTEPSFRWLLGVSLAVTSVAMILEMFRSQNSAIFASQLPDAPSVFARLRYLVLTPQHPIPFYLFGFGVYWLLFRIFRNYIRVPDKILRLPIPKVKDPSVNRDPLVVRYIDRWYFLTGMAIILLFGQYLLFLIGIIGLAPALCKMSSFFCGLYLPDLNFPLEISVLPNDSRVTDSDYLPDVPYLFYLPYFRNLTELTFSSILLFSLPTIRFLSKHALLQAEVSEAGHSQKQSKNYLLNLPKRFGIFSFVVFIVGVATPFIFKVVFSTLYLGD